jgi:hypothetical protein
MQIDARELDLKDLLAKLKEILSSKYGCNVSLEILVSKAADVQKITAFVSMSGCKTNIDKKNNYYIMHVEGIPCCA